MVKKILFSIVLFTITSGAIAQIELIKRNIQSALKKDRDIYKIGAIAVSFQLPHSEKIDSFYSGSTQLQGDHSINANNLFQVGSITKSFIAALILQLESEHRLKITDTIEKYLPHYSKWRRITIKQLLNHTSGIYNYTHLPQFDHVSTAENDHLQWTPERIVDSVYHRKLYFPPGKGFHYSNTNYILLGMIIHAVTRHSVQPELERRFLHNATIGLKNSYYFPDNYPEVISARMVSGYFENKNETNINMSWVDAAGALVSNSIDIARWMNALFVKNTVLPSKQLAEMTSVVSVSEGKPLSENSEQFAYGLGIKRRYLEHIGPIWFHPGATTGYTAIMIWAPQPRIVLVVTTNAGNLGKKNIKAIAFGLLTLLNENNG